MEILYFWINKSSNPILNKKEILLSNRYIIEYKNETLSIVKNENYIGIYDSKGCAVRSVSGLVGKNGSGKTSILDHLYNLELLPLSLVKDDNYSDYMMQQNELEKGILVTLDNNRVHVYCNFDLIIEAGKLGVCKHLSRVGKPDTWIPKYTRMFITNDYYCKHGNGTSQEGAFFSAYPLTPKSMTLWSKMYYDDYTRSGISYYNTAFNAIYNISKYNENMDLQHFFDIKYFSYLIQENRIQSFAGKVSTDIKINIKSLYHDMERQRQQNNLDVYKIKKYQSTTDYIEIYNNRKDIWKNFIQKNQESFNSIYGRLRINLILEMDFITSFLNEVNDINDLYALSNQGLELIKDSKYDVGGQVYNYYMKAMEDISRFEDLFKNLDYWENALPASDLASERDILLNINRNFDLYSQCIKEIDELFTNKSFIIKYLKIKNMFFSSGERAFLNIFSWMHYAIDSKLHDVTGRKHLYENIIICLDEIDLYCHPEWQQKFLFYFIDELNRKFKGHSIQIILTTHSPICLSDIPSSNLVYFDKLESGNINIYNDFEYQTFASNIYKLFNNAFFLSDKGAIGSVAKSEINGIIESINSGEKSQDLLNKIGLIGEPVIKSKLVHMYNKVRTSDNNLEPYRKSNLVSKIKSESIRTKLIELIKFIDDGGEIDD